MSHEDSPLRTLRGDVFRYRGRSRGFDICAAFLSVRTFRPIFTLRVISWLRGTAFPLRTIPLTVLKLMHRWFCAGAAIDFSHETRIGSGLCITHGWGLVVSPGAVIGENCTLFHGVTIGRKDLILPDGSRQSSYPVIEDDCWIGPGASVLGGVTVGKGSIIGAGAVVTRSVPPASVVVGNPGKVVKSCAIPDVYNRPPRVE